MDSGMTTFGSDKEALMELLGSISSGKIQLPDFQRGWIWDDEHVRSLLASISLSYPIGAVMLLETGNEEVQFKPRPVEGVRLENLPEPDLLILDGQQRLTSLFQALLMDEPVSTRDARGKPIKRWYYLDISKALDPFADREEAIISVPEDRKVRNFRGQVLGDYSTVEKECSSELLPIRLLLDQTGGLLKWQTKYVQNNDPEQLQERFARWTQLAQSVIQRFQMYQVPLISLRKETPKEAVCQVFEKVNTGGVSLTVFELLTATYAANDYSLRDDWEGKKDPQGRKISRGRKDRLQEHSSLLKVIGSTDLLQTVTLLATYFKKLENPSSPVSCKRKDILRLPLDEYKKWVEPATRGFEEAAKLLYGQKVFTDRELPYRTQIVPLAAIMAILGERVENAGVKAELARWFWCGVFGELYGSAIETRFARDVQEVPAWLDKGVEPSTITEANFAPSRLLNLRTRNSAAYKGLQAFLMRDDGRDFRTGETTDIHRYFDERMDVHHIFPQKWCRTYNIEPKRCDSAINKTPLSSKTNRKIGGNAPSVYLVKIQEEARISEEQMNEFLRSHAIDPIALRADDFEKVFSTREQTLLGRIESAMGKPIATDSSEEEVLAPLEYEETFA